MIDPHEAPRFVIEFKEDIIDYAEHRNILTHTAVMEIRGRSARKDLSFLGDRYSGLEIELSPAVWNELAEWADRRDNP